MLQPSPLKEISSRDLRRQGVIKQTERKLLFHWLRLVYRRSLSSTKLHFSGLLNNLDLKVFSSGCSQHVFPQIDFWRTLTVQNQSLILSKIAGHLFYRIGVDLLFSGKEETRGSGLAGSLLLPRCFFF